MIPSRVALFGALMSVFAVACDGSALPEQDWWQTMALGVEEEIPVTRNVFRNVPTPTIVAKYGYPCETHTIRTEDGYILSLHRIPNEGKPVVYLQHGILSSSADWVVLGPGKALALILHDAGYDVWLGNSRGTTYSRNHVSLQPTDGEFWDFSWHEIGLHDIPAAIDFILKRTRQPDLYYVGHSQGTTVFYVLMSMKPEYNAKVRAMFSMAPISFMHDVRSVPVRIVAKATNQLGWIASMLGMHEFLPNNRFLTMLASMLCKDNALTQTLCTNVLFLVCGYDSDQLNTTMLPEILENIPAGAATKQFLHYGQLVKGSSPQFRMYDYGWIKNYWKYGQVSPPEYDLSKVTARVHLLYGLNDLLAVPTAVTELKARLPNVMSLYQVPYEKFNHLDFLFAKDGRTLLYDNVMDLLDKHEKRML